MIIRRTVSAAAATAAVAGLALTAAIPAHAAEYSSALKIKGVQYDAPGRDSNKCSGGNTKNEYLTIKNYSKKSKVNLKGYKVRDKAGNTFVFKSNHILEPGDYVHLRGGRGTDSDGKNVVYRQNCNFMWNNDKDTIYFYKPGGTPARRPGRRAEPRARAWTTGAGERPCGTPRPPWPPAAREHPPAAPPTRPARIRMRVATRNRPSSPPPWRPPPSASPSARRCAAPPPASPPRPWRGAGRSRHAAPRPAASAPPTATAVVAPRRRRGSDTRRRPGRSRYPRSPLRDGCVGTPSPDGTASAATRPNCRHATDVPTG